MKHHRAANVLRAVGFLLLAALLALALSAYSTAIESSQAKERNAAKFEAAEKALKALEESQMQGLHNFQRYDAKDVLVRTALSDLAQKEGDGVLRSFGGGCVVRVESDSVVLPEDYTLPIELRSQDFRDGNETMEFGAILTDPENPESGVYLFQCIFKNYYYVYPESSQYIHYVQYQSNLDGFIADIEAAFDGYILLFYDYEGSHPLYHVSDKLVSAGQTSEESGKVQTLEDLGIFPDEQGRGPDKVEINGETFDCISSLPQGRNEFELRLMFLTSPERVSSGMMTRFAIIMAVALIIMSCVAVWVSAARHRVQDEVLRKAEFSRYAPRHVRRVAVYLGLAGIIVLGLTSMFVDALMNLYSATNNNITSLQMLEHMIDRSQSDEEAVRQFREEAYTDYAKTIAEMLTTFPQLQNREVLGRMSDVIQADYLIIYDRNGNQRLSDSRFVGLSLSREEGASTYEFRKLLSGKESIAHGACTDETTGLNREMIGVSMGDVDTGYEALLIAVAPDKDEKETSVNQLMTLATTSENLSFSANPESGDIVASNFGELCGKNALSMGMDPNCLKDDMTDFIYLGNEHWYAQSDLKDGLLYYYSTRESALFSGLLTHAAVFGGMFAIIYVLLMLLMMADYTKKVLPDCTERLIDNEAPRPLPARTPGILPWSLRLWWMKKTPEEKTLFVFTVEIGVALVLMLMLQFRVIRKRNFDLISFIMNGQWQPGFNLFALTKIVVMSIGTALLLMLLRMFSNLIVNVLERRARTLVRFGFSLVQYAIILVLIYFILTYLGLNITGIMTTIAGMTLAISLLAKDLISDMLGGLGNALSNHYQIGDFIEISDGFNVFRGWVQDISMSRTLLIDEQGNAKVMSNRDVRNVLNLSRGKVQYVMKPTIISDLPLEKIEEIMQHELPAIGAGIHDVISGPTYKGIIEIGNGGITLEISVECRERSYGKVRAAVNREVYQLLQKNGIQVR